MNREQYLSLLKEHDDPVNWEVPGGWENYDYRTANHRFLHFAEHLEKTLASKCEIESGSLIQNASFIGQVILPDKCVKEIGYRVVLRISHFGNFAALSEDDEVQSSCAEVIRSAVAQHGYRLIPSQVLAETYDGKNSGVTGIRDWWIRYFDWI